MKWLAAAVLLVASAAGAQDYVDTLSVLAAGGGGGGGGSPPTATTNSGTASATGVATATVNLPASIASGNVLFVAHAMGSGTTSAYDLGTVGEYTEIQEGTGTNNDAWHSFKVATGSEGATATANWTTNSPHSVVSALFAGTSDTTLTCGTAVTSTASTNPDPPSVSFTAPATIITVLFVDTNAAVTGDPSGYAYACAENSASGSRVRMCMCQASTGTDCSSGNPGAWTMSTEDSIAQTCAIEDN